ncbi:unnamed protein product [Ilex paraguariensis]|uniref:GYF domain-containing protein n=1 Tax=Ilex paraguariensis TaxID=185542 RepID=A0ABC8TA00_9AQUA
MDPSYESEEDYNEEEDNRREAYMRPRSSGFNRRGREPLSPGTGDFSSKDSWSTARTNSSKNWEFNRNLSSKNFSNKAEDATPSGEIMNENLRDLARDKDAQQSKKLEKQSSASNSETVGWNSHSGVISESFSGVASETSPALSVGVAETAAKPSETEKIWRYQDPSGKVQGPFSIVQLRKWSNTGYFPVDLRIWRTTKTQDDSILLNDALAGRFPRELPEGGNRLPKTNTQPNLSSSKGWMTTPVEVPKLSTDRWGGNDSSNLPSPTPKQSTTISTIEVGPLVGASSFSGGNEALQSPAATPSESGQVTRSSALASALDSGGSLARDSENYSQSSQTGFNAALSTEQGVLVGDTNSLRTSQPTATTESLVVQTQSHLLPAPDTAAHTVQSVNSQNTHVETHTWANAPSQNVEPNSAIPVHGQPQTYGHWVSVTSGQNPGGNFLAPGVQDPAGNLLTPGSSALPQPDFWRPPIAGNQSNMQPPAPSNVPWGGGISVPNIPVPISRTDNQNTGWGPIQVNPNMGWGGPAPGGTNMNWGATIQGPSPGNVNPGWVVPTGNPGATVQGPGPVPGNVNPGWVAPTGNPGAMVQGLAPGIANQGWVAPHMNTGATVQGQYPGMRTRVGFQLLGIRVLLFKDQHLEIQIQVGVHLLQL